MFERSTVPKEMTPCPIVSRAFNCNERDRSPVHCGMILQLHTNETSETSKSPLGTYKHNPEIVQCARVHECWHLIIVTPRATIVNEKTSTFTLRSLFSVASRCIALLHRGESPQEEKNVPLNYIQSEVMRNNPRLDVCCSRKNRVAIKSQSRHCVNLKCRLWFDEITMFFFFFFFVCLIATLSWKDKIKKLDRKTCL